MRSDAIEVSYEREEKGDTGPSPMQAHIAS
jgi:hypothetical protein